MKAVFYLVSGLFLCLGTACSPVIYEAPHGPYYGHGHSRHSSTVIVKVPTSYGHPSHRHGRHHIEQELARRHHKAAGIYRGEGRPWDLIEITIQGGYLYHQGRRIHYRPATFRLAAGDVIRFPSAEPGIDIYILYERGRLALDTDIFGGFPNTITRVDFRNKHHKSYNFSINNKHLKGGRGMVKQVILNQEHPRRYEAKKEPRQRPAVDHKLDHDKRRGGNTKIEDSRKSRTARRVEDRPQVIRDQPRDQPERRSNRHVEQSERRSSETKSNAASGNDSRRQPGDRKKKNVDKNPRQDRSQEKTRTVFEKVRKERSNFKKNGDEKSPKDRKEKNSFTREDRRTAPVIVTNQ